MVVDGGWPSRGFTLPTKYFFCSLLFVPPQYLSFVSLAGFQQQHFDCPLTTTRELARGADKESLWSIWKSLRQFLLRQFLICKVLMHKRFNISGLKIYEEKATARSIYGFPLRNCLAIPRKSNKAIMTSHCAVISEAEQKHVYFFLVSCL